MSGADRDDVCSHLVRTLVPVTGSLLERPHEDRVDVAREAGINGARSCRRFGYVLVADTQRRITSERRLPEEELIKQAAHRVEIAAVVDGQTPGLFR